MPTIAVLDSDPAVVSTLTRRLSGAFAVAGWTDAAAALDAIEAGQVDVLVTDILGAGIDGLALVLEARRRKPQLPVVVVSTYAGPSAPAEPCVVFRYVVPGSRWNKCDRDRVLAALAGETEASMNVKGWTRAQVARVARG